MGGGNRTDWSRRQVSEFVSGSGGLDGQRPWLWAPFSPRWPVLTAPGSCANKLVLHCISELINLLFYLPDDSHIQLRIGVQGPETPHPLLKAVWWQGATYLQLAIWRALATAGHSLAGVAAACGHSAV